MTAHQELHASHLGLKDAISSGSLSEPLEARARDILRRIEEPVRVGIFGAPRSGKSSLINLLLGAHALPECVRLPTLNLSYGDKAVATCTLPDGTQKVVPCDDMVEVASLQPAFVEAKLPLAALTKLNLLEVVASTNQQEQRRALVWGSQRVDMVLWCTSGEFDEAEQNLWDFVPENIQDHSYLIITHNDQVDDPRNQARVSKAKRNGRDCFSRVLPIGTMAALAARKADGSVDKDKLRSAGAVALISSILKDVETGRQDAIARSEVFLRQIDFVPEPEHNPAPQPVKDAARAIEENTVEHSGPEAPQAASEADAVQPTVLATAPTAESVSPPAPQVAPNPSPVERTPSAEVIKLTSEARVVLNQAVEEFTASGTELLESYSVSAIGEKDVFQTCVDTVIWLSDFLDGSTVPADARYENCCDLAFEAADLVQLMRLETGEAPACDLISLMIQLKKEMQVSLAA